MTDNEIEEMKKKRLAVIKRIAEEVEKGGCPPPGDIVKLKRGMLPHNMHNTVSTHVVFCDKCAREYLALEALDKRGDEFDLKGILNAPISDEEFQRLRMLFRLVKRRLEEQQKDPSAEQGH